MSYNLGPNIKWGAEHRSDFPGYSRTVNKDRTMLSAAWIPTGSFQQAVGGDYSKRLLDNCTVASKIMKTFHSVPSSWFPSCHVCVVVSTLHALFIPGAFLARVAAPQRPHTQPDMLRRSRQAIIFPVITTLLTFRLHVSFASTLSLLPIHITSHIDHLWYPTASFLP